jgi:DNA-binding Lrp family transcriptional regulator
VNHAERQRRDRLVVRMHLNGATYRDIAERVGITHPAAIKIVKRELERAVLRREDFDTDAAIELYLQRQEQLMLAVSQRALQGDIRAVEAFRRINYDWLRAQGLIPSLAERSRPDDDDNDPDFDDDLDDDDVAMVVDLKTRKTSMRGLDRDEEQPKGPSGT